MSAISSDDVQFVCCAGGHRLAYRHTPGLAPTVVFLSGYASDMSGSKALYLESVARQCGQAFVRLDYSGHGLSDGDFVDGTIRHWAEDAVTVIEHATRGPVVLVGSSMGGWIMLLVAAAMRDRVAALMGIAAAPDFTEDLMWEALDDTQRRQLRTGGELYLPSEYVDDPYPVTWKLIEDGRRCLSLRAPVELSCPVRLVHGMADPDVPWRTSVTLADRLVSNDVRITLIKHAGHRLSDAEHLTLIAALLEQLITDVSGSAAQC